MAPLAGLAVKATFFCFFNHQGVIVEVIRPRNAGIITANKWKRAGSDWEPLNHISYKSARFI